jgi:large conductance mechanosensitive channel
MIKGFRDFVLRGNVVELAVAVAIGTAFTALVAQFSNSFIKPLVALVGGGGAEGGTFEINGQNFDWGAFVNAVIFFVITAAVIYFLIVAPMNTLEKRRKRGQAPEDVPPTQEELLTEIRDLLRAQAGPRT